jgi:hypothetical protein
VYGKALGLRIKADVERSNQVLEQSINQMMLLFELPDVPKELLVLGAKTCADWQIFRGKFQL